jgi:SAM-dependent methyltransferase
MDHSAEMTEVGRFFDLAIGRIAGLNDKSTVRVLDFGCGAGEMMALLARLGYDTYGCDVVVRKSVAGNDRIREIVKQPYRIPYPHDFFDVVTSTSVLEHARNPDEYMPEICRVLKPGGHAMHILPGKWYLPWEPHLFVPLANAFWPHCPTWWFALWARLGIRKTSQESFDWRKTVATNRDYYDHRLIYLTVREYDTLSRRYFAEHDWPMQFFLANSYGGLPALSRRLPFPRLWGWVSQNFRMGFLVQRKEA